MGSVRHAEPSLLVIACFSRNAEALDWGRQRLEEAYGPIELTSKDFNFHHTKYYEATMGSNLIKRLHVFQKLVPSDCLADVKLLANSLEKELAEKKIFSEPRPLNLDPGLLQLGKFVLASTKDQAHRIYLREGIYAEVTLRFQDGAFEPWPWTYRDYREPEIREFLRQARSFFRQELTRLKANDA